MKAFLRLRIKQRTRQFTTFFQDNNRGSCITYKLLLHYFFSQNSCKVFSKPEILQSFFDQKTFCVKYSWNRVFVSLPKKIEIWNNTTLLFSSTLTCNFDKFFPSCEFVNNLMGKKLVKVSEILQSFFQHNKRALHYIWTSSTWFFSDFL